LIFGAIPLMTEGASFHEFQQLDLEKDIKPMCEIRDIKKADDLNKLSKTILGLARNYDT
jgi:hypothetical protein